MADLHAALTEHLGDLAMGNLVVDGCEPEPGATLADAGVCPGATLMRPAAGGRLRVPRPAGRRSLQVIAGPDGGLVIDLPEHGSVTIGRDAGNTVVLANAAVSRHHAVLDCTPGAVVLRDVASSNGTELDGEVLTAPRPVPDGATLRIGDNQLRLGPGTERAQPAVLSRQPDGRLRLDRRQRFVEPTAPAEVRLPRRPHDRGRGSAGMGWAAVSSLVLGVVAYFVFDSLTFLLLSAASTATLLVSALITHVRARKEQKRAGAQHEKEHADGQNRIAELITAEHRRRWRQAPGPPDVVATAQLRGAQLWERRRASPDFLEVRVGLAAQPAEVVVRDGDGTTSTPTVGNVPLTVPLAHAGTIGVIGRPAHARALARWVVLQAVVQSGPADLRLAVLTAPGDRGAADAWDWVRWLPHARTDDGPPAVIGADPLSLQGRIDELNALAAQRQQTRDPGTAVPRWLLVVDGLPANDVPGLADLLQTGPDAGITVVAVAQLPYRCPVTVTFEDEANVTVHRAGEMTLTGVVADQVGAAVAARAARALAPLLDPQARGDAAGLPDRVALLDELPETLDPAALAAQWRRVPRRTDVVVGRTGDGPLTVDLAANGPHALVAGATGFGKSAFLQTLIASMAVANRPDELGFILVDFKGGAAFAPFAALPHVMGMITNLDGHQVMRALDSLAGEIIRRQETMRTAGVEKLSEYHRLAAAGMLPPGCPERMPRMCVVIDEFAILREKLPDEILRRLVHVATQGRSIGLHLILGTQTPRGAVPPEIAENAKLRVALHLSADHSQDVVGTPDAKLLTVPGRALIRRGQEADVTVFQSAYVGGRTRRAGGPPVQISQVGFDRLGHQPPGVSVVDVRDIEVLSDVVRAAAAVDRIGAPQLPWLPELPPLLDAATLPEASRESVVLAYGREDWPQERRQPVAAWDLAAGTHLLAAGRPRSGRTTLLRTLAAAAARYRTDQIHLYVMDCGGALADLADLAHCGAYLHQHETARGARLLDRLERRVIEGPGPARTLLLIDDWEIWQQTFGEVDNGALHEKFTSIVRKGPAAGVHIAVTGGSALLTSGRARVLTEASHDRIALPFDADDYAWIGLPSTARPAGSRPGLAVRMTAPHRTLQVATVSGPVVSGPSTTTGAGPWRVDALPGRITSAEARELLADATTTALCVGGDTLRRLGADTVTEGPAVYVAGERHGGRSTALLSVALDALERGVEVVAVAPGRGSALRHLSGLDGVAAVLGVRQPTERQIQLALAASGPGDRVILVDDADQLQNTDGGRALARLMQDEDDQQLFVVAADVAALAAPAPGSLLAEIGRGGTGLLLTPRAPRVHLFGTLTRLPEAYVSGEPPGRAVLLRRGGATPVQIPYASAADTTGLTRRAGSVPALLQAVEALAGPAPTTVGSLREIVVSLREAGFDALDGDAIGRAAQLAHGWNGSPGDLVASARFS